MAKENEERQMKSKWLIQDKVEEEVDKKNEEANMVDQEPSEPLEPIKRNTVTMSQE